jgi:hypothetical protein
VIVALACLASFPGVQADEPAPLSRLNATVSWLGNTFPGATAWVQQDVKTIHVLPDGTVYTNVEWDEGGGQVAAYRDGTLLAIARHTHGWGQEGGLAVAANTKYLYLGQSMNNEGGGLKDPDTWPPKGRAWFGVARRLRSDITQPAPFAGGKGGKGDTLPRCFLPLVETSDHGVTADLPGLAANDLRLYASNPHHRRIDVLDAETMQPVAHWPCDRPGPLALDADGSLWVLQTAGDSQPARVLRLDREGRPLPQRIAFPDGVVPTAIAVDPPRHRLLVADDGPDQQIRIYDQIDRDPRLAGTLGVKGGILAGPRPGQVGPLRFNRPSGVGVDDPGNIYVACDGQSAGGGTGLESYSPEGSLRWRVVGLEFVDMADVDPGSDSDIYTKEEHFHTDATRPRGQEAQYVGFTIDRLAYPDDPRLHIGSAGAWVRRIEGRPFLFVTEMNAGPLQLYRFDPEHHGEIAIPSALFAPNRLKSPTDPAWPAHQPEQGEWIWRDADGNGRFDAPEYTTNGTSDRPAAQGWWVDDHGDVWLATETSGIRKFPHQGLDAAGNPVYDFASMHTFPAPPGPLERIKRLRYDSASDVMYLGGTTAQHANQHWKPMGPVICRYDAWSHGPKLPTWTIVAPYATGSSGHESCEPMGFDVAGDYLFVPYTGASKANGFKTGHIEVFRSKDGASVGHFEPPNDIGEIGLQDIRECLRAHRRADGEYLVFLEEDAKAKILIYHWRP